MNYMQQLVTNTKPHLTNLLLEQYKQECIFEELEKFRMNLGDIGVNNLDIILSMIGFPEDNSSEGEKELQRQRDAGVEVPRVDDYFCRDWLDNRYYEMSSELRKKHKVIVHHTGMHFEDMAMETEAVEAFTEYVDWLFHELEHWDDEPSPEAVA